MSNSIRKSGEIGVPGVGPSPKSDWMKRAFKPSLRSLGRRPGFEPPPLDDLDYFESTGPIYNEKGKVTETSPPSTPIGHG
jgi:hypothetical protein